MTRKTLIAVVIAAAAIAGCGSDDDSTTSAATNDTAMKDDDAMKEDAAMKADEKMKADDAMTARSKGTVVKVVASDYGRVIADRKGEAYYLFDKEQGRKSECYGDCAVAWPPVFTKGKPRAGKGAQASKLGTTRRRNGRLQVTYAGHPLYYYKDDSPGNILCHDVVEFGGTWLVVEPSGRAAG